MSHSTGQVLHAVYAARRTWNPRRLSRPQLLVTGSESTLTQRLTGLQVFAGRVAEAVAYGCGSGREQETLAEAVLQLAAAAFAFIQIVGRGTADENHLGTVRLERQRQNEKFRLAVRTYSADVWMAVLTEEVGEVAEAILEVHRTDRNKFEIYSELIQVCAVAVFWLEQLPLPVSPEDACNGNP